MSANSSAIEVGGVATAIGAGDSNAPVPSGSQPASMRRLRHLGQRLRLRGGGGLPRRQRDRLAGRPEGFDRLARIGPLDRGGVAPRGGAGARGEGGEAQPRRRLERGELHPAELAGRRLDPQPGPRVPPPGDAHLLDHGDAFARLEPHLGHVPQVVELRSDAGHRAVGDHHARPRRRQASLAHDAVGGGRRVRRRRPRRGPS